MAFTLRFTKPKLRITCQGADKDCHANWLELFFDLAVALLVSQVAGSLSIDHSWRGFFIYVALFLPVVWIWMGHTVYSTRFGADDLLYKLVVFVTMFLGLGMGIQVKAARVGATEGYALCYLASRALLHFLVCRASYHIVAARPLLKIYLLNFAVGAGVCAAGFFCDGALRHALWTGGLAIEMIAPWIVWFRMCQVQLSTSHLPERMGLFVLIVLGESLIRITNGLAAKSWGWNVLTESILAFGVLVGVWWIYFAHLDRVIGKTNLRSSQPFLLGHVVMLCSIVVAGVGVEHAIKQADQPALEPSVTALLFGAAVLWIVGLQIFLHAVNPISERHQRNRFVVYALALGTCWTASAQLPPPAVLSLLFLCQLVVMLRESRIRAHTRHAATVEQHILEPVKASDR